MYTVVPGVSPVTFEMGMFALFALPLLEQLVATRVRTRFGHVVPPVVYTARAASFSCKSSVSKESEPLAGTTAVNHTSLVYDGGLNTAGAQAPVLVLVMEVTPGGVLVGVAN
jgi:hypothetical protein